MNKTTNVGFALKCFKKNVVKKFKFVSEKKTQNK